MQACYLYLLPGARIGRAEGFLEECLERPGNLGGLHVGAAKKGGHVRHSPGYGDMPIVEGAEVMPWIIQSQIETQGPGSEGEYRVPRYPPYRGEVVFEPKMRDADAVLPREEARNRNGWKAGCPQ